MASLSWLELPNILSFLALLISFGTFLYVAKTYTAHYRPYIAVVDFKHRLEGNPPTLMNWHCGIKNVGSIPAWIEMTESSVTYTTQGQTQTTPVGTLGKLYLAPDQLTHIDAQIPAPHLNAILNGTTTFQVHVKLTYEQLGGWWKKKYHYASVTQFLSRGALSAFVQVSTDTN